MSWLESLDLCDFFWARPSFRGNSQYLKSMRSCGRWGSCQSLEAHLRFSFRADRYRKINSISYLAYIYSLHFLFEEVVCGYCLACHHHHYHHHHHHHHLLATFKLNYNINNYVRARRPPRNHQAYRGGQLSLKDLSHNILPFWVILAVYNITSKLKETWKQKFTKIENHQSVKNKPERNKYG